MEGTFHAPESVSNADPRRRGRLYRSIDVAVDRTDTGDDTT